jgi:hypothetical protein
MVIQCKRDNVGRPQTPSDPIPLLFLILFLPN